MRKALEQRFWEKVDKTPGHGPNGDCWLWTAHRDRLGYGKTSLDHKTQISHRVAFSLDRGIDLRDLAGFHIMHSCDWPPCQRPDHLSAGTAQDNMNDKKQKGRQPKGEFQSGAKLTEEQVKEIHRVSKILTTTSIASLTGVSDSLVSRIIRGKKWSHVKPREVS